MKRKYLLLLLIFVFVSCKQNTKVGNNDSNLENDSVLIEEQIDDVYYLIPSPYEIAEYLNENPNKINSSVLNSVTNIKNYQFRTSQALNLGVYSADLSYLALSGDYSNANEYFEVIGNLCNELQIPVIEDNLLKRINNNLKNADSLQTISNELYFNIVEFLNNNQNDKLFALIASGFFIESLYISIMLEDKFSEDNKLLQRIYEQNFILNSLITVLSKYSDYKDINSIYQSLDTLNIEFQKINYSDTKKTYMTVNDTIMIKGEREISLTVELYESIKNQILNSRNTFIYIN